MMKLPTKTSNYGYANQWLAGPEFHASTLKRIAKDNGLIIPANITQRGKDVYVDLICNAIIGGKLDPHRVLEHYAKEPRTWLSFRIGTHAGVFHQLEDPVRLFSEFGEPGWYGPIIDSGNSTRAWYIRTFKVRRDPNVLPPKFHRWTVIAEVSEDYVALTWRGFSLAKNAAGVRAASQYPFWDDIPNVFMEIKDHLDGKWELEDLFRVILDKLWEKYREHPQYEWRDLRVRADKFGVILNAHSSRVKEISGKGLRSFSSKLAQVAVRALPPSGLTEGDAVKKAENAIIRTLVKEWGTKSYEFCLDEKTAKGIKTVFLAHCFFGEDMRNGQDSLQHLHCAMSHGGSEAALQFLLRELNVV